MARSRGIESLLRLAADELERSSAVGADKASHDGRGRAGDLYAAGGLVTRLEPTRHRRSGPLRVLFQWTRRWRMGPCTGRSDRNQAPDPECHPTRNREEPRLRRRPNRCRRKGER
eukprot:2760881-Pleurochrysis_carterae.AAC.1